MLDYKKMEDLIFASDKIYIDTCSLMKKGFPKLYDNVKYILKEKNKRLVILERVCDEIEKYKEKGYKEASRADKYIKKLLESDLAIIKPACSYELPHADHAIKADFIKYYVKNKMLLISNDYDLAMDILEINNSKPISSRYLIQAVKISKDGYLEPYSLNSKTTNNTFGKESPFKNRHEFNYQSIFNVSDFLHKEINKYKLNKIICSINRFR